MPDEQQRDLSTVLVARSQIVAVREMGVDRLLASKSPHVTKAKILILKEDIEKLEAADRAKPVEEGSDLEAIGVTQEEITLEKLLDEAKAYLLRADLKTAPERLRRRALGRAAEALEAALESGDADARNVAAERLRRLLLDIKKPA